MVLSIYLPPSNAEAEKEVKEAFKELTKEFRFKIEIVRMAGLSHRFLCVPIDPKSVDLYEPLLFKFPGRMVFSE